MCTEGTATAHTVSYSRDLRRSMTKAEWLEVYWRLRVSRRRLRAARMVGPNEVYIPSVDEVIGKCASC